MKETKDIKHTPASFEASSFSHSVHDSQLNNMGIQYVSYVHKYSGPVRTRFCASYGSDEVESKENAELIAEAFNVSTETGLTPKELADRVSELSTDLLNANSENEKLQEKLKDHMHANEVQHKAYLEIRTRQAELIIKTVEQNKELLEALKSAHRVVDPEEYPNLSNRLWETINKYTKP